jgi:hypothetical protein
MLCRAQKAVSTNTGGRPGIVRRPQMRSQWRPGILASIFGVGGVDMR